MTLPKILLLVAVILFTTIGVAAVIKRSQKKSTSAVIAKTKKPIEIDLNKEAQTEISKAAVQDKNHSKKTAVPKVANSSALQKPDESLPHADRIAQLFNRGEPKLPFVETITYRSRVPWQKGRPAWLSDYASHYSTSRHFIARSLNGKPDYFKQDIAEGDRFNVLRKDKNINFYLLIDTTRCRLWLYALDMDKNERFLLKDYQVGLGREDPSRESGLLTPRGKYTLGNKIAIYKPKMTGFHNGQKVEMIRVFGTRWIPFDKELMEDSASARGIGLHGVPWISNEKGELVEDLDSLGKYMSDGCIRLSTNDVEELFAIIITKPTTIELVKDFYEAQLPGIER
jgi:hypothetical protein